MKDFNLIQTKYFIIIMMGFFIINYPKILAQDNPFFHDVFNSNIKNIKSNSSSISFAGSYRFLGFVRNQKEVFPNNSGKTTAILSGDNFREPMLLLKLKGLTKDKISFGADFMLNSPYKGPENVNSQLTLELGLNLRTSFSTSFGKFNLSSGGVNWYRQSRLTVWGNRSFNRESIYHRRPQTRLTSTPQLRYENYFNNGLIDEGVRYGNRAFQGIFINGQNLPKGFSLKGVIGKTPFNRSILDSLSNNYTGCIRVRKKIKNNFNISYNYLNSTNLIDTINNEYRGYSINTLEFSKKWNLFSVNFEAGLGNYYSPENDFNNGEALILNISSSKKVKYPIDIQAYRISTEFVNLTGNFLNTSVLEIFPNTGSNNRATTIRPQFNSPVVGLGIHTNNRQGISINAQHSFGKFKINTGVGISSEIDTSISSVSYRYNVNAQTLSRLYLFARDWGPYNTLNSTYRNIFENVSISDTNINGFANFKKHFANFEFQAKYSGNLGSRKFYIFFLSRFNSCGRSFHYFPKYNLDVLISQISNQIDLNFEVGDNASLILNFGIERIIGNHITDLGDNNDPSGSPINMILNSLNSSNSIVNFARNQRNRLIGLGLDYKIGKGAMIFFRHNLYSYYDPNFVLNNLKGSETMLELKILF